MVNCLGYRGHIYSRENLKEIEQDTRVWVYMLISNVNVLHKNNVVSQPALAMGIGRLCDHVENFEKITQYTKFGCIFLHNYAFKISHFLYKLNNILNVEGSSIVLNIDCFQGACSFEKFYKKWHNLMSFSEYSDIISS